MNFINELTYRYGRYVSKRTILCYRPQNCVKSFLLSCVIRTRFIYVTLIKISILNSDWKRNKIFQIDWRKSPITKGVLLMHGLGIALIVFETILGLPCLIMATWHHGYIATLKYEDTYRVGRPISR